MAKIIGYGLAKPTNIVKNADLEKIMDTSDEWITSRTGIKQRNIHNGEISEIALDAAKDAINDAKIVKEEIDFVICSTNSPDDASASTAARVAEKLKLKSPAVFDTNSACTGFISNIVIAKALIDSGQAKIVLIISAEMLSRSVDWTDRATAVLFGDGAGAVVMTQSKEQKIFDVRMGSLPSEVETLDIPGVYSKTPFSDARNKKRKIIMNGHVVFNFAIRQVSKDLKKLILDNKINLDEIKYIVAHQANIRIIQGIAKKINCPIEKFFINMDRWANTSSATIPICLAEMKEKNLLKPGDKIILTGFGGGLTFGSVYMEV